MFGAHGVSRYSDEKKTLRAEPLQTYIFDLKLFIPGMIPRRISRSPRFSTVH